MPAGVQSPTEQSLSCGKKGGTLTALQTEDFEHLDPGQSYFQIDYGITSATQRSLYAYKPNTFSEVTPDLAEGPPQFSDGNKLVTIKIRKGIKFSPPWNKEVTADDVVYAFERVANENVANPYWEGYLKSVEGMKLGKGGPIPVMNAKLHEPNLTSEAFIRACLELGYPPTDDFNGPNMEGAGWHHINVKDGQRHSTRVAYLEPALKRPNLTLSGDSQATRLLFDGTRCIGVEYSQNGQTQTARASREVIVCAGAIESPKHRFFIATLFQPQLSSKPEKPHPIIVEFLRAAAKWKLQKLEDSVLE